LNETFPKLSTLSFSFSFSFLSLFFLFFFLFIYNLIRNNRLSEVEKQLEEHKNFAHQKCLTYVPNTEGLDCLNELVRESHSFFFLFFPFLFFSFISNSNLFVSFWKMNSPRVGTCWLQVLVEAGKAPSLLIGGKCRKVYIPLFLLSFITVNLFFILLFFILLVHYFSHIKTIRTFQFLFTSLGRLYLPVTLPQ